MFCWLSTQRFTHRLNTLKTKANGKHHLPIKAIPTVVIFFYDTMGFAFCWPMGKITTKYMAFDMAG
jgi:hypothetical protein